MFRGVLFATLVALSVVQAATVQYGLDDYTVAKVKANLQAIASQRCETYAPRDLVFLLLNLEHSWEYGTEMEALLELEWPTLAVFEGNLPPPTQLPPSNNAADVIDFAIE